MSSDIDVILAPAELELGVARRLLRDGRMDEAEASFRRVLDARPDELQALRFLGSAALRRGAAGEAMALLNRAADIDRTHIGTLIELGVAYRVADRMDASRYVFERALELSEGRNTAARLLLANVLELDQRPELALLQYFRAILDAQQAGRWHDDDSTEPRLRPLVRHAMQYVAEGRHRLFHDALQPWRERLDLTEMDRIDRALTVYLREASETPADARQRAGLLHVPGLGTSPRADCAEHDWMRVLESRIGMAAAEIDSCLTEARAPHGSLPVYATSMPPGVRRIDIYRRGSVAESARRLAPQVIAALGETPLLRVSRHGPDAAFMILASGSSVPPHYGCSNARFTVVLGLPGTADLEVIAGGEPFHVRAGEGLLFDASFALEYVNRSASEARVLVFDVWHPALGDVEQQALGALIAVMVDFDTQLQELS